jgi:hypothetical protein
MQSMTTRTQIVNISPTLFLNSLPSEKHADVQAMFNDVAVDHIILFVSNQSDARHIVPVGHNSQYKEIPTLTHDLIEGMHPLAVVDAQQPFPNLSKIRSPRQHSPLIQSPKLKSATTPSTQSRPQTVKTTHTKKQNENQQHQAHLLQNQVKELKRTLAEVRGKMMLQEQTIAELNTHIEQLEQNSCSNPSNEIVESVLSDRENSVTKAEEELINRLTYLMEKEAELEQYEENLASLARSLDEREKKLISN